MPEEREYRVTHEQETSPEASAAVTTSQVAATHEPVSQAPAQRFAQAAGQRATDLFRRVAGLDWAEWFKGIGKQLLTVLRMETADAPIPLYAALIGMLLRSVAAALIVHVWFNKVTAGLKSGLKWLFGSSAADIIDMNIFGWLLLGLVAASAVAVGLLYVFVGRENWERAVSVLLSAQWPLVVGLLAGFVLSYVWLPLSILAIVSSVAWGQALLARGLMALNLTRRWSTVTHMVISAVNVAVTWFIVYRGAVNTVVKAFGGLF